MRVLNERNDVTYGKVFKIYDDQDSGNICVGVQNGEKRYLIKVAVAPTEQCTEIPKDAIDRLKERVQDER